MTKQGLVEIISKQRGITKKLSEEYINAVFDGIKEALKEDDKVSLQGIMSFEVRETPASSGVLNGKEWSKPEGYKIVTKVSDTFKKEVLE